MPAADCLPQHNAGSAPAEVLERRRRRLRGRYAFWAQRRDEAVLRQVAADLFALTAEPDEAPLFATSLDRREP